MRPLLAIALVLSACGASAQEPTYGLDQISFGIDMHEEARDVERASGREGYRLLTRIEGARFVAFDARGREGASRVRVVTKRGVVLALDAVQATSLESVALYDVLREPSSPELVARVREAGRAYDCYRIFVVDADGGLHELRVREGAPLDACLRRIEDIDGDGMLDVVGAEVLPSPHALVPPLRVLLPLTAREGALVPADRGDRERVFERLANEERLALADARARGEGRQALRIALVLARMLHLRGAPSPDSLRAFDDALDALVLTEDENDARRVLREAVMSWSRHD